MAEGPPHRCRKLKYFRLWLVGSGERESPHDCGSARCDAGDRVGVVDGGRRRRGVVEPVEKYLAYLAYLTALERSPNTVVAYASSLRFFFEFLRRTGLAWDQVSVEDVARFVSWLRALADKVIVLAAATPRRSAATVNRHLAAVFGFFMSITPVPESRWPQSSWPGGAS